MNNRERVSAILHYSEYDRLPLVHFGFWNETLEKWRSEGHISAEEERGWGDGNAFDDAIGKRLGFDFNWQAMFISAADLFPAFEPKVIKDFGDGTRHVLNSYGVVELQKDGAGSIPSEISHTLVDRASWEREYLPRLRYSEDRINFAALNAIKEKKDALGLPLGLHCGSLYGTIRNWLGIEGISYLYIDDEELYDEILSTVAGLSLRIVERVLQSGIRFDYGHFWEDICFKNGPLVVPTVFKEKVGPHYRKITSLLNAHGIDIVSLDCDGFIDALIPTWIENGVNTMFPIEVGTWDANIAPWRRKYGRELRGVGGMNKTVFAHGYAAVDREVERLKALVDLGGYIPCPDHRIAPDAKWENVQYYCERMRSVFQ